MPTVWQVPPGRQPLSSSMGLWAPRPDPGHKVLQKCLWVEERLSSQGELFPLHPGSSW